MQKSFDCRAVMVDLDGTMVDTLGDFVAALNLMLADLGLPPVDRLAVELRVGKGSEHLIRSVLEWVISKSQGAGRAPDAAALYDAAWASYQRHYRAINGEFSSVYEGVEPALKAWRAQGLALACLTNKPLAFAEELLRRKGLSGYFSQVFGGDSFERKKPDPMPLQGTAQALGVACAEALMVGDSVNDALAARAAGCPVVLVTYGYNHGEPIRAVDADGFVDRLDQIRI